MFGWVVVQARIRHRKAKSSEDLFYIETNAKYHTHGHATVGWYWAFRPTWLVSGDRPFMESWVHGLAPEAPQLENASRTKQLFWSGHALVQIRQCLPTLLWPCATFWNIIKPILFLTRPKKFWALCSVANVFSLHS